MKKFLAIYTGSKTSASRAQWDRWSDDERHERQASGLAAWREWASRNQAAIVDGGGALGQTKQVSRQGLADIHNNLAAYVIVRADSHEAAARLFADHPHFSVFPGDGVEIMECLPVPGG